MRTATPKLTLLGRAWVFLLPSFCFAACGLNAQPAIGGKGVSWSHDGQGGKAPLPGIDHANVNIGIWRDGAAIVVWDDAAVSGLGGSRMGGLSLRPGETRTGARYEGNSGLLKIECYTPDGTNGKVTLGGQSFDLARGALFLVSTSGSNSNAVKQLSLAKLNLKPRGTLSHEQMTVEVMQSVAATDADIRTFFSEAAKAKPLQPGQP
jgi:hypothetical protein